MRLISIAVLAALLVLPLKAQDVPLPQPRPDGDVLPETVDTGIQEAPAVEPDLLPTEGNVPLPRPRPEEQSESSLEPDAEVTSEPETEVAAEPEPEEPRIYQTACPAVLMGQVEAEALPPISEGSCDEQSPLSVTAILVHGRMVPLSSPAVVNCEMASTLPAWAEAIDGYLGAKENTRLSSITAGMSYMCRNRNNAETGDVSEHGFADALDVVGFALEDGRSVTVEGGWADALASEGRLLRFAHDSACSMFTTTLGPEANALHHDHLHLDLGCHGRTCSARLCE